MGDAAGRVRWATVDSAPALPGMDERVTHPEFAGIEFVHVRAKKLLNEVPAAAGMPFRWTINVYRGCTHDCVYCLAPDTPILMADGRTRRIADVRVGDRVLGTGRLGRYRRYVTTEVLDHWATTKRAYRVTLGDGTQLIASGDHRFLTHRGWKHVTGVQQGRDRRPHLTVSDQLLGTGGFPHGPKRGGDYPQGYLCGAIRGDGTLGEYEYLRSDGLAGRHSRFRLALADEEALDRVRSFLEDAGISPTEFNFGPSTPTRRPIRALRVQTRTGVAAIRERIAWPNEPSEEWAQGFLAGIFDAEGSYSHKILRISNTDPAILEHITTGLDRFGFDWVLEDLKRENGLKVIRVRGGLDEHLRFFLTVDPAITRKRTIDGTALKNFTRLAVARVEDIGIDMPMYDLTTGTGDFVANGIVSHNCFARPSHAWLELDPAKDFGSVIVVKVNAVERLRAELRAPSWEGEHIALGTNTDPYQRCEGRYRLTRGIVETLSDAGNRFSILTKGTLVTRDLDVLAEAAARGVCTNVSLSIPTLDDELWRASEPGTPHPQARMQTVAALADAGIPAGVMVAPIIPGLSDDPDQLEAVVRSALDAGASAVTPIVLHLRPGVKELMLPWIAGLRPELVERYQQMYRGSYAPKDEQRRITGTVRRLVERHGGTRSRHRRDARRVVIPAGDHRRTGHWTPAGRTGDDQTHGGDQPHGRDQPHGGEQLRLL